MIYLDNAATTPLDPRVAKAMSQFLSSCYGNPSNKFYEQAETAKKTVNEARKSIASFLDCKENEIIFTSSATESNNKVIKGMAFPFIHSEEKVHLITSKAEHKATLECCRTLEKFGVDVTYLNTDQYGCVSLSDLKTALSKDTKLVSLIWGNNELGSVNPVEEIGSYLRQQKIPFHVDGTQVYGKFKIKLSKLPIDFLSFSGHKVYGPKGVGGCFIKRDRYDLLPPLEPLIHGGQQEFGIRAGTESTHNILGLKTATEIAAKEMEDYIPRIMSLEKLFLEELHKKIPSAIINSPDDLKVPGILSITIPELNSELFLKWASKDFALSAGSACALGESSHVLKAIGKERYGDSTLRVSIGKYNAESVINLVGAINKFFDEFTI